MADSYCIVDRLEVISSGLAALEGLGALIVEVESSSLSFEAAGAPVFFIASTIQSQVTSLIEDMKRSAL